MPDSKDQTWDDLYVDDKFTTPTSPVNEEDDPINEIKAPAATDTELETAAQKDVDPVTGEVDPAAPAKDEPPEEPANVDADKPGDGETKPPTDPNEDLSSMSGIEKYLSQFDIEGGMMSFDDGSSVHFTELETDKQAEILSQLHSQNSSMVEEKYGLDENEIGLINYLRTNKLTVEQMIDTMASDRVSTMMAVKEMDTQDFTKASEDSIYLQFLKQSDPEATTETLEADLAKAKEQTNYPKLVDSLRKQYIKDQNRAVKGKLLEGQKAQYGAIEEQRKEVVEAISSINDISGISLNDGIKNGILDKVLEVNDYGDSKFMEEVFSDPSRLFNAAFWYYYGPSVLDQRDNYWKQQKSAAYTRGRDEALGGSDSPQISFTSKETEKSSVKPSGTNQAAEEEDWLSLHT